MNSLHDICIHPSYPSIECIPFFLFSLLFVVDVDVKENTTTKKKEPKKEEEEEKFVNVNKLNSTENF